MENTITRSDWNERIYYLQRVLAFSREWHRREQGAARLHPAIMKALERWTADSWHSIILEHPHQADSDPSRLAYTRSDEHGQADRQTVTSVGKYLKRHFSTMPDHLIRDITALYAGHSYELMDTSEKILDALSRAPSSCMRNHNWTKFDQSHPYAVYDPAFGWKLAISKKDGKITGRCLVNDTEMIFVRSYNDNESFSHSSEGIETWLKENGYSKASSWHGMRLKHIPTGKSFLAPYLDGEVQTVSFEGDHLLITDESPDYECSSQNGRPSEYHECTCEMCDEGFDEDDLHYIESEQQSICESCIDAYFSFAYTRGRNQEYVRTRDCVYVESQDANFHTDYLSEHDIVELDNGDFEHMDYAVYLEQAGIWVHCDDESAVYCEESGTHEHIDDCVQLHDDTYALREDAWQCVVTLEWYTGTDEQEIVISSDGQQQTVHTDELETYFSNQQQAA